MLPIGQALWLKELETYVKFPPMQDPASYNLDAGHGPAQEAAEEPPEPVTGRRAPTGMAMARVIEKLKEEFLAVLPPTLFFFVALHIVSIIRVLMAKGTNFQPLSRSRSRSRR